MSSPEQRDQDYRELQDAAREFLNLVESMGIISVLPAGSATRAAYNRLRQLANFWR